MTCTWSSKPAHLEHGLVQAEQPLAQSSIAGVGAAAGVTLNSASGFRVKGLACLGSVGNALLPRCQGYRQVTVMACVALQK